MKPRLLDLFAGAQGAGIGYVRAGFEVHAVDIAPHPKHPDVAAFIVADAMQVLEQTEFCRLFDVIHASPPCQRYSLQSKQDTKDQHPDLIGPVRERLQEIGRPYVIENVTGARRELDHPIQLCGSSFGLGVWRHRLFEVSEWLMNPPPCQHTERPWTVTGGHGDSKQYYRPGTGTVRARKPRSLEHAQEVMGIDWMGWDDLCEAIPPAYTTYIGEQLLPLIAPVRATA
jgi:DNA (cytosine-5)-methyltransferase 1